MSLQIKVTIFLLAILQTVLCAEPFKSALCPDDSSLIQPCVCGQYTSFPLPSLFCNSTELTSDKLKRILKLSQESESFNHLQILNGDLKHVPAFIDGGKDFIAIMLGKSGILDIDPRAFEESKDTLETLIVRENPDLKQFPFAGLSDYEKLASLFLHENGITDLKGLATMKSVSSLMLNKNKITELEPFPFQPMLRYLSLMGNQLSDIPKSAFYFLPKLAEVDLAQNKLTILKKGTLHFNSNDLISIVLKDCGLERIEEGAFDGVNPHTIIDLSNNKLESIPEDVFSPLIQKMWKNIGVIRLGGNPLKCSCMKFGWLTKDKEFLVHLQGATCDNQLTLERFLEDKCSLDKTEL